MTLVFKFGGASVKDAPAVRNVAEIIRSYPGRSLLVVVSAMHKTTNDLEALVKAYAGGSDTAAALKKVEDFHAGVLSDLFPDRAHPVYPAAEALFRGIRTLLRQSPSENFDYDYDQLVCHGELLSSLILTHALQDAGIRCTLFDARKMILTDMTYREGRVNWDRTVNRIRSALVPLFESPLFPQVAVTQGFIGGTVEESTTTLGREGSDFTAAVFAFALEAEEVTIWKDVPGLLNADPKHFTDTRKIDAISYREALELSYFGAGVIHPNTIKPLQNKSIPLRVKSFVDPQAEGTLISAAESGIPVPCFIRRPDQWLLSISPHDFSYITEAALTEIFGIFSELKIRVNMMQNSAISFSVCIDDPGNRGGTLVGRLTDRFRVLYNRDLCLLTVRNYDQEIIDRLTGSHETMLEQRSRYTFQAVIR